MPKGAFTGAIDKRVGIFEEVQGGTLFLDEIGDLSITLQAKLLRVIQERKIKRVGENQYRPINLRLISATHKNLRKEILKKTFREDLFYRLNVIQIHMPPLRERPEDILLLAEFFLEKFVVLNDSPVTGFTCDAREQLLRYHLHPFLTTMKNPVISSIEVDFSCQNFPFSRSMRLGFAISRMF